MLLSADSSISFKKSSRNDRSACRRLKTRFWWDLAVRVRVEVIPAHGEVGFFEQSNNLIKLFLHNFLSFFGSQTKFGIVYYKTMKIKQFIQQSLPCHGAWSFSGHGDCERAKPLSSWRRRACEAGSNPVTCCFSTLFLDCRATLAMTKKAALGMTKEGFARHDTPIVIKTSPSKPKQMGSADTEVRKHILQDQIIWSFEL